MSDLGGVKARKRWFVLLLMGILVLVLGIGVMLWLLILGVSDDGHGGGASDDVRREIAQLQRGNDYLLIMVRWVVPFLVLATVMINVARFKLRKLKKLRNSDDVTH